ncbi:MAG: hypothetical protein JNL47_06290 [Bacteroidia bacterium]|nr:hypothetical protein [Bacteroidia bacterium]
MASREKLSVLIKSVKELSSEEREQFTSELLLMMVNESGNDFIHQKKSNSTLKQPNPEADCKELAFLLKRLNYQHDEYIHRII